MSPTNNERCQRRNVALLALCQGLLLTNGVTQVAVTGLVGLKLAPDLRLATLPATTYVLGAAAATLPAAFLMKRYGRRFGFMLGACIGILGGLVSAAAVWSQSFLLLCLGTICAGIYNAIGQQYRFAAADAVDATWKSKAISLTLAGGILGGIVGPALSTVSRDLLQPTYVATYLTLSGFAFLALLVASRLTIPPLSATLQHAAGRPLREIARQPAFVVAVLSAACGYGVMNLLMTATPIAMDMCRHPFAEAAFVLEWHVIGMFAPSFFTGAIIRRVGIAPVLLTGAALMLGCIGIALSGLTVMHFWWALFLLGVGWNFLYIGGTTLLTETHRPAERAKVQGSNDVVIFAVQGITALGSGALVTGSGWMTLNILALPAVTITALAIGLWWRDTSRRTAR
jgi:MFS family permease